MTKDELYDSLIKYKIPVHMHASVANYMLNAVPPGDFLYALLTNNLVEVFACADLENEAALAHWVDWLYNKAPSTSWGSPKKVERWLALKRTK